MLQHNGMSNRWIVMLKHNLRLLRNGSRSQFRLLRSQTRCVRGSDAQARQDLNTSRLCACLILPLDI